MDPKSKAKAVAAETAEQNIDSAHLKPGSGRIMVIASAKEGRRRAGLEFSGAGTEIDFEEISQEQWELILADPLLTIRPAPAEPKADVDA